MDGLRGHLNERQEMGLLRMFREGPEGFKGGLSAGKYIKNHRRVSGDGDARSC